MKPLLDSSALRGNTRALRTRMKRDGYVLVHRALPPEPLEQLESEILRIVDESGWLSRAAEKSERLADASAYCFYPQKQYMEVFRRIYCLEAWHALPHHPALTDILERILGEPPFLHPGIIGRVFFPTPPQFTGAVRLRHQDHADDQGTTETYTAWFPLHACRQDEGMIAVAEGSHAQGLLPFELETIEPPAAKWRTADLERGDVLIFHSLTVHKTLPNYSPRLRFSMDARYQRAGDPIANVHLGHTALPAAMAWQDVYAGFKSTQHQYFWKKREFKSVVPYEMRDAQRVLDCALRLGERGDKSALYTLAAMASLGMDPELGQRAERLVAKLMAAS